MPHLLNSVYIHSDSQPRTRASKHDWLCPHKNLEGLKRGGWSLQRKKAGETHMLPPAPLPGDAERPLEREVSFFSKVCFLLQSFAITQLFSLRS